MPQAQTKNETTTNNSNAQQHHQKAADIHQQASVHHDKAAKHHESGDGVAAAHHAKLAHDHADQANDHSNVLEHSLDRMAQDNMNLHEAMKITPDQEGPWKRMTDSRHPMTKANPGTPQNDGDHIRLTAPERAEKRLEHMQADQTNLAKHVIAIKDLYAVLNDDQKAIYNDYHAGPRGSMRGKPGPATHGLDRKPHAL